MINSVTLAGRLTRDPDLCHTQSGTAVEQFTLAADRSFTNQQGDREAGFTNCAIQRKAVESFVNYAHKSVLVGLAGHIRTRNYDNQQGQRVYMTEIVVENFQLLEPKEVNDQRRNSEPDQATLDKKVTGKPDPLDPFSKDISPIDISDDDLPF